MPTPTRQYMPYRVLYLIEINFTITEMDRFLKTYKIPINSVLKYKFLKEVVLKYNLSFNYFQNNIKIMF